MGYSANNTNNAQKNSRVSHGLLIVLLVIVGFGIASELWQSGLLPNGSEAPDWSLPLVGDTSNTMGSTDLKGQVVVLNFWSTTCGACIGEIVELQAIWQRMTHLGVVVIGVSTGGESLAQIKAFARKKKVDYPMVLGNGAISMDYKVGSIPTTYVIDREGKIAVGHRGFWDRESIQAAVNRTLGH